MPRPACKLPQRPERTRSPERSPTGANPALRQQLLVLRRTAPKRPRLNAGDTVSKYLVRGQRPPSQTWRTFLQNHIGAMVSVDFFTVPTIRFQVLYVFLVLAPAR